MTIKTLTYIHNLLKEENDKRERAYRWMRDLVNEAEEKEQANVQTLKEQADVAWNKHIESRNALADFESQDF